MTLSIYYGSRRSVVFLALIKRGGGTLGRIAKHAGTAEKLGLELYEGSHRYISRYTCTLWLLQVERADVNFPGGGDLSII